MRSLSLHIKTTILASVIILLLLMATLFVFSLRVSENLRENQKEIAGLQAESLAEQISNSGSPRDYEEIARAVELIHASRPSIDVLRIWEREGNVFVVRVSSLKNESQTQLNEDFKIALRGGNEINIEENDNLQTPKFRVLVPVFEGARVSGAVEVVENLETVRTLVSRYFWSELGLAIGSVTLLSLSIYALFRYFVYQPLGELSVAMQKAKTGALEARARVNSSDEIGEIAEDFNRMLAQIGEFSAEREKQKEILQEKVLEATTELQNKNFQLTDANREIWRTSRKMSELERLAAAGQTAAQFAHEVGTPLNLISGHVQLLRLKLNDNEAEKKRLDTISTQIERIERIVRTMLDRTRVEALALEKISLFSVLRKVFDTVEPSLETKNIKLVSDLNEDLPLINGNADHLQQVFINLINNAMDAMLNGGEIKMNSDFDDHNIFIEISDNGTGMTAETKARIFEPLYTTKARGHGTGLGLVVVRQIMIEHRGEISVESQLGKGTTFRLSFPKVS